MRGSSVQGWGWEWGSRAPVPEADDRDTPIRALREGTRSSRALDCDMCRDVVVISHSKVRGEALDASHGSAQVAGEGGALDYR